MKRRKSAPASKPSGKTPVGRNGQTMDVHEERLLEDALKNSETRLAAILSAEPECVKLLASDLTLVYMNPAGLAIIEADSLEQVRGKSLIDALIDPQYRSAFVALSRGVFEGKAGQLEYVITGLKGGRHWLETHAVPLMNSKGQIEHLLGITRDITDRKMARQNLQASEARFRALIENSSDAVALFTREGRILYSSPATTRILGYRPEELEGRNSLDLVHPEDLPPVQSTMQQIAGVEGKTADLISRVQHKGGTWRFLEGTFSNLLHDPNIKAIVYNFRDVTERKQAEEALQASELRFRALIENSSDAIILFDAKARVLYSSPTTAKLLGYQPEEVVGRGAFEFIHPEDFNTVREGFQQVATTPMGTAQMTSHILHKDGRWRVMEGTFTNLLHDPNVQAIVNNYRDVTDRVRAQEALRHSEDRFARAFQASPLPISVTTRAEGRFVLANEALVNMLECNYEDIIGHTAEEVGLWASPESRKAMLQQLEETGRARDLQSTFKTPSGRTLQVELSFASIQLDDVACVLGVSRDVTEEKNLELQLRQAQKMDAVGQLAGGVAHDFNNLVMIINGSAELIKESVSDSRVRRLADEVLNAGKQAASVTKQLLAFSRKQPQDLKVLDLNDVVSQFCEMFPRFLGEDIELMVVPRASPASICADPGQIEQVIMNLIVNARDAMPRGGTLTVETFNATLDEDFALRHGTKVFPGEYVMLAVSDTGIGMEAETQRRIFEPFFTTKEIGKGTGLGLATVYGIVKQHQGFIWVYSEVDQGTTLKVYLPLVERDGKIARRQLSGQAIAGGGSETILLVEDQGSLRKIVAEYLTSRGYKVLEAANGAAALKICETLADPIHLFLSDVVMPGIKAEDFVRSALQVHPEARVIFMSGYTDRALDDPDLRIKSVSLQKPLELQTLLRTIRSLLDRKPNGE